MKSWPVLIAEKYEIRYLFWFSFPSASEWARVLTIAPRFLGIRYLHYNDAIMGAMTSQITIVYSTVCSVLDKTKYQSSALLASVRGIHRWPVNLPHKGPVTQKMFPFDDVIMRHYWCDSQGFSGNLQLLERLGRIIDIKFPMITQ